MADRRYRVTVRGYDFSVEVDGVNEDQAIDNAVERARDDADFDVVDVTLIRGEPDPPPLPDVGWIPEPARSLILASAPAWDGRYIRVWCVLVHGHPWATNGCWAFRLPEGTAAPDDATDYTQHLSTMADGATDPVDLAAVPHEQEESLWNKNERARMVYACGDHWPLDAVYADLLEELCESDRWFRGRPADPGVLRDASGESLALLMPVRPNDG